MEKQINKTDKLDMQLNLPKNVINFRNDCISRNLSQNTIDAYMSDLKMLFKFLKVKNNRDVEKSEIKTKKAFMEYNPKLTAITIKFIREITYENLNDFLTFVEYVLKNSVPSKIHKIATIKAFYHFLCVQEESVVKNISGKIVNPKTPKKRLVYMTVDETKNLLITAKKDDNIDIGLNKRNFCIITLLSNNGIRRNELRMINVSDISFSENLILIREGKGDKERVAYLNKMTTKAIKEYLEERNKIDFSRVPKEDQDALFISHNYNRICKETVANIVKENVKKAGITKKITTHKMRTSFAMQNYKNNVSLIALQKLMGHSSIVTLQKYVNAEEEEMRLAINNNQLSDLFD